MADYNPRSKEKKQDKQVEQINIAPHSIEAEQAVLGGIMLSNDQWDNVVERIQASDFYTHAHRVIFEQMEALVRANSPIDIITLEQALKDKGVAQDVGGFAYLAELSKNTPSAANILAYADIVRDRSDLRSVISASNQIAEMAYHTKGRDSKEVLDEAERIVFEIAEKRNSANEGPQNIDDVLMTTLSKIELLSKNRHNGGLTGITTGFIDLNKKTAGLQPSDLIIIAARPSMGKTTFAMNLCENAALSDVDDPNDLDENGLPKKKPAKPVLIFSLEMPRDQIMMRMLASLSRVDQTKIRTGQLHDDEDWAKLSTTISILQGRKISLLMTVQA